MWGLVIPAVFQSVGVMIYDAIDRLSQISFPLNVYLWIGLIVAIYQLSKYGLVMLGDALKDKQYGWIVIGGTLYIGMWLLLVPLITIGYPFLVYLKYIDKK